VWKNYVSIWQKINFGLFTFNSFKLSIIITLIQVFTSSFAAYGFAKCHFRGRDTLFFIYIATIAIPWQVYMLPQYVEMRIMHLTNTHLGYIFMQSFIAFGVFLMRQFYVSIPDELLDAARIDGLTEYGIYGRVVLPLSGPVIATLSIFSFVNVWNDFMGPMIYFDSNYNKTIPLGIRMFLGQYSTEYGLIMAASVVSLVPVFVVFLFFQRFFVEGIATSGLKG
jgi:multiple sugar transport system permease protein